MATWELTTEYKKSAVERQHWYKDGKLIIREEGYRWGKFYCESDTKPNIDLSGDEEYDLAGDEYEWELDDLDDGCWTDWTWPSDMSDEDRESIEEAWDENYYEGLEELGWSNDDTMYYFQGPLKLKNLDTGEEFTADEDEVEVPKLIPSAAWPFSDFSDDEDSGEEE